MAKKKDVPLIVRGLDARQWIEIKFEGTIYLVALSSLLAAYRREQNKD